MKKIYSIIILFSILLIIEHNYDYQIFDRVDSPSWHGPVNPDWNPGEDFIYKELENFSLITTVTFATIPSLFRGHEKGDPSGPYYYSWPVIKYEGRFFHLYHSSDINRLRLMFFDKKNSLNQKIEIIGESSENDKDNIHFIPLAANSPNQAILKTVELANKTIQQDKNSW